MDVFVEYMVKRRATLKDTVLMILYALIALAIFIIGFFFGTALGPYAFVGTVIGVAAIFGAYFLISSMNVEYEYIVTNGEIDVDKIMARRKRKRLVTANARTFEEFGPYHHVDHQGKEYSNRVYACTSVTDEGSYYAVFNHTKLGKTLLVFSPNDRVLESLKTFIPRQVAGNVDYGNRSSAN
ncbi:MAG: DUF6106 family protein [Oscillospiraceae bacterium]